MAMAIMEPSRHMSNTTMLPLAAAVEPFTLAPVKPFTLAPLSASDLCVIYASIFMLTLALMFSVLTLSKRVRHLTCMLDFSTITVDRLALDSNIIMSICQLAAGYFFPDHSNAITLLFMALSLLMGDSISKTITALCQVAAGVIFPAYSTTILLLPILFNLIKIGAQSFYASATAALIEVERKRRKAAEACIDASELRAKEATKALQSHLSRTKNHDAKQKDQIAARDKSLEEKESTISTLGSQLHETQNELQARDQSLEKADERAESASKTISDLETTVEDMKGQAEMREQELHKLRRDFNAQCELSQERFRKYNTFKSDLNAANTKFEELKRESDTKEANAQATIQAKNKIIEDLNREGEYKDIALGEYYDLQVKHKELQADHDRVSETLLYVRALAAEAHESKESAQIGFLNVLKVVERSYDEQQTKVQDLEQQVACLGEEHAELGRKYEKLDVLYNRLGHMFTQQSGDLLQAQTTAALAQNDKVKAEARTQEITSEKWTLTQALSLKQEAFLLLRNKSIERTDDDQAVIDQLEQQVSDLYKYEDGIEKELKDANEKLSIVKIIGQDCNVCEATQQAIMDAVGVDMPDQILPEVKKRAAEMEPTRATQHAVMRAFGFHIPDQDLGEVEKNLDETKPESDIADTLDEEKSDRSPDQILVEMKRRAAKMNSVNDSVGMADEENGRLQGELESSKVRVADLEKQVTELLIELEGEDGGSLDGDNDDSKGKYGSQSSKKVRERKNKWLIEKKYALDNREKIMASTFANCDSPKKKQKLYRQKKAVLIEEWRELKEGGRSD